MVKVNDRVQVLQGRNSGEVGVVKRVSDKGHAYVDFERMITLRDDPFSAASGWEERDAYWVPGNYLRLQ